jgi:uncharacterized protein YjbI with pentapeptide repeats
MLAGWKNQRRSLVLLFTFLLFSAPVHIDGGQTSASPTQSTTETRQELENNKLRQETIKLRLENQKLSSPWVLLLEYGPLLTALVAVGGFIFTFWKQIAENQRQGRLDYTQREHDRQQQRDELQHKLEEQFSAIITNLGSESSSLQASAAVQIMGFLRPEYRNFHAQAFLILYANLKVQHNQNLQQNRTLGKLLVSAFEQAIRTQVSNRVPQNSLTPIDLSRSYLNRAQLQNLDLTAADIAFSDLRGANLTGTSLFRVRGYAVHLEKARLSRATLGEARLRKAFLNDTQFHEANLIAADLREANLSKAQFQQAKMQSAHLDRADLTGARFEHADLNDTFFFGATIPTATLKSILKAKNWKKAHYDPSVWADLLALHHS